MIATIRGWQGKALARGPGFLRRLSLALTVAMPCAWMLLFAAAHAGLGYGPARIVLTVAVAAVTWLWFWSTAAALGVSAAQALPRMLRRFRAR